MDERQSADYERVVFVKVDEWAGIYLDGVLIHQGHEIPDFEWVSLLQRLGIGVSEERYTPKADALIEEGAGRLPAHIGSGMENT